MQFKYDHGVLGLFQQSLLLWLCSWSVTAILATLVVFSVCYSNPCYFGCVLGLLQRSLLLWLCSRSVTAILAALVVLSIVLLRNIFEILLTNFIDFLEQSFFYKPGSTMFN